MPENSETHRTETQSRAASSAVGEATAEDWQAENEMMAESLHVALDWPDAPCCWPDYYPGGCVCEPAERALRAWKRGETLPPMTFAQREYCLSEIASVEGYRRADYESDDDAGVASGVLSAWTDFCRDKGLL